MTEKNLSHQCLFHSGMEAKDDEICRRCTALEETNREQWTAINKKAGSAFLMWGFGILVVVLLGIFTGLWRSQVAIEGKIIGALNSHNEVNTREQKDINEKIGSIRTDLTVMQNNFENYTKTGKWPNKHNRTEERGER